MRITQIIFEIAVCDCTCECWGCVGTPQDTRLTAKSTSVPNAFPQDQRVDPNLVSLLVLRLAGKWSGRWVTGDNYNCRSHCLI